MMDLDLAIELLIGNTERLATQSEKITDRLNSIDITMVRLSTTIELHEKRSTNLEKLYETCKQSCDIKMEKNTREIAKIRTIWKTIGMVLVYLTGAIATMAGIVQIIGYYAK